MIALAPIAGLILASAAFALTRRNLVHSALLLILTWAGIGMFYLWAGAEFLAFAQILIYAGAISMVVLFAVLLTRVHFDAEPVTTASYRRAFQGVIAALAVGTVLTTAVLRTQFVPPTSDAPRLTVRDLGTELMTHHAGALLIVGLILTVALLGATTIAAHRRGEPQSEDQA